MSEARRRFVESLGFAPDDFQVAALDALDRGVNVLVSAPTGSGKTMVANYAVRRALDGGGRAFYTTPLKALSNQKFHELGRWLGPSHVGLLTGDASVNRRAPVVVMTTEVLRNMILTESDQLRDLSLVVLDEVHFLQDPFRGGVWEEVLILTPPAVTFVALSATVGNAATLGEWLEQVRGPTSVVVETQRPITLHDHVALVRRGQTDAEVLDLLDGHRLSDEARRVDTLVGSTRRFRPGPRWHGPRSSAPPAPIRPPRRSELLLALEREDLLPVIVFIFSRAACEDAVRQCVRDGLRFTNAEQRREVELIATRRVEGFSAEELAALEFDEFLHHLQRGLAPHHAGMVPAFREVVESCFERNLLGAVFATETLALGINMPARSVALERFSKYSDAGRATLTSGDFAQMTGRAGRRGLDDEGHAVVCFSLETSLVDVARVATAPPPDLHSSFRPTYNLTANLTHHFDLATATEVVERSFAQFEANRRPTASRWPLSEQMLARHRVMEELGYADGWRLTDQGQLLRSIYHESDLLVAEATAEGLFDGLAPEALAGVASALCYEAKRTRREGESRAAVRRRRPTNDRLGPERRGVLAERVAALSALSARVRAVEERHRVPHAREPDGRFATTIAAWARGAPLGAVLDVADAAVGPTSPGDFVRQAKQVADLCEQLALLHRRDDVAGVARAARDCLLRSVVVAGTGVHPLEEGSP
ncbi:MAG TPA: DEAD/DEAH box helicase [Acidimicrobiales bacterium]|nr:DEAD/DEAH box helicase [Acidimicrobiales bacterium]